MAEYSADQNVTIHNNYIDNNFFSDIMLSSTSYIKTQVLILDYCHSGRSVNIDYFYDNGKYYKNTNSSMPLITTDTDLLVAIAASSDYNPTFETPDGGMLTEISSIVQDVISDTELQLTTSSDLMARLAQFIPDVETIRADIEVLGENPENFIYKDFNISAKMPYVNYVQPIYKKDIDAARDFNIFFKNTASRDNIVELIGLVNKARVYFDHACKLFVKYDNTLTKFVSSYRSDFNLKSK